jgi:hypothetical protein
MKKSKTFFSKIALMAVFLLAMLTMSGCTAVQISANLKLNEDGTGSRTITASIAKNDYQDGYGSAYYYLTKHGDELAKYLQDTYTSAVKGSKEWLNITVDDTGKEWETVNLSFDFTSFDDYKAKLASLAYDPAAAAAYAEPELITNEDGTITYKENAAALTAVFKSIQTTIMKDNTMFDINCTKDGKALNDGSADLKSLTDSGVELMKPDYGNAMTIQFGANEAAPVEAADGVYTVTGSYSGGVTAKEKTEHVTSNVLNYGFNGDLKNAGTEAENDLTYGNGSTEGGPIFTEGIDGQAIQLDGNTYLASPNKTYAYDEMTVSFYYKIDAYTNTDTGANMIIVPAGLGALGAGVIDLEFIKDSEAEGVQLLAKMNSADWQTQDKLYSEGYFMELHLEEWHNYTIVFQNEYDEFGNINDAFIYMYIDGQLAVKSRLSVAAGLPFSLGSYDDGSSGTPNGGFNVGGYYENETVKRACTGVLDNLMIFDGALSEEDVKSLCYTTAVSKPYDPATEDVINAEEKEPTALPAEDETSETSDKTANKNYTTIVIISAVAVAAIIAAYIFYNNKKKK